MWTKKIRETSSGMSYEPLEGTRKPREKKTKSPEQALQSLMRLCARAEKSEGDARRLMRGWGVADVEAEKVLQRLVKERFIDDRRYAEAFVREKVRLSGWGGYKIRQALQRKGVAASIIDEALQGADSRQMKQRLAERLQRKAKNTKYMSCYDLKAKLIRYGLSLGFDYETVMQHVKVEMEKQKLECEEF